MKTSIEFNASENLEESEKEDRKRSHFLSILYERYNNESTKMLDDSDFCIDNKIKKLEPDINKSGEKVGSHDSTVSIQEFITSNESIGYLTNSEVSTYIKLKEKFNSFKNRDKLEHKKKVIIFNILPFLCIIFLVGICAFIFSGRLTRDYEETKLYILLQYLAYIPYFFALYLRKKNYMTTLEERTINGLTKHLEILHGQKNYSSEKTRKNLHEYFNMVEDVHSIAKKNQTSDVSLDVEIKALERAINGYFESNQDYIDEGPRKNTRSLYLSDYNIQKYINLAAYNCAKVMVKLNISKDNL